MDVRKAGQGGDLLVDPGVILHGAGAQGIEAVAHAVGLLGQGVIVPVEVYLGQLGQRGRSFPAQGLG